jgi:hypothetical protein
MSSPATSYTPPVTSASDDEVLVRVEGVSKKFCRSLKKSLWYGVCDIASELNPFGRVERMPPAYKYLTTEDTECTEAEAKVRLAGQAGAEFSNPSASGLARGSENTSLIRAANNLRGSGDQTGSDSASAEIGEIFGKNANGRDRKGLRDGEFFAVKDVSFELRRGECLGLIGHNGAGKTTLLKMLNGLIKPDRGTITMRGRVGALIALGAGFNPILTGREPEGWEACRKSNRRLARRAQRRRDGASQNIYINGSVLGLTKKEPERRAAWRKGAAGRPGGLRDSGEARTKSMRRSTRSSTLPRFGNLLIHPCRVIPPG